MAWPSARFVNAAGGGNFGPTELNGIQDQILRANGILDTDLATAVLEKLALPASGGAPRRSVFARDAADFTNSVAFTVMPTADQVTVTAPTDGFLKINYRALWWTGLRGASDAAAIFVDGVQLQKPGINGYDAQQCGFFVGTTDSVYCHLHTIDEGLFGTNNQSGAATIALPQAIATTGGAGGSCYVKVAAGARTVSIRFKGTTGNSIQVEKRRLWVEAYGL